MTWGNQGRTHYVYGAGSWSQYYWSTSQNPNATFTDCMANCTTYAYGRVKENGFPAPVTRIAQANYWHTVVNTSNNWKKYNYTVGMMLYPGDILEWNAPHVAVVETEGTSPWISASWYTGDHGVAEYPQGSGQWDTRSVAVMGSTLQDVSDWMNATSSRQNRFYHYNLMTEENSRVDSGNDPLYVLRYEDAPTPPTPTVVTPVITITPSSYNVTMQSSEDYVDFTFDIVINGIPYGESAQGGNTYPDLTRVYNTGWSYSTYSYQGVIYQTARKTQTLRYERESANAYTTTKHMYYNLTFSNGSITSDTPMVINVLATGSTDPDVSILAAFIRKRKRHIQILKRKIATK